MLAHIGDFLRPQQLVDGERNLIFVKGGVPGPKGGFVKVRKAVKKLNA